jgi:alpha-L-fucosidase 2
MMQDVRVDAHPVEQYESVWTAVPSRTPANHSVDGPLMGNGDMTVAVGGPPEAQCFYLAKNDFWRLKSEYGKAYPAAFGHLAIRIPALEGAGFWSEQTWAVPETVATFTHQDTTVRMRSMVAATRNILLVELTTEGQAVEAEVWLNVAVGAGSHSRAERRDGICVGRRAFADEVDIPTGAAVAWTLPGVETHPCRRSERPRWVSVSRSKRVTPSHWYWPWTAC